jgi:hippurate hydrolase
MDALPMQEFNTFAHASRTRQDARLRHDGHVAMLLAAAGISRRTATSTAPCT